MTSKKVTAVRKDLNKKTRKFNINRKLLDKIFGALKDVDIQHPNFVSKTNNQKDIKPGGIMPSPSRDGLENQTNPGEGLGRVYGTKPASSQEDYPEGLNPFDSELKKRKLSALESEWLGYFKSAIVAAKSPSKMHEVVNEAIKIGMRMNGRHEEGWSFAEQVVLGTHFHKFKKGDRKEIMHKLMVRGARFRDALLQNKLIGEICNELEPKIQPQIDKQLEELRKVSKNAIKGNGTVEDVEIDNATFYVKFSKDGTIKPAEVLEGTRNLGLNNGWVELGSNILKIDDSEVEVRREEGGKTNYTGVSNNSDVTITFYTSIGELRVRMYHNSAEGYHRVQLRVVDTEKFAELQKREEEVGKNCLFGGKTVEEAIREGSFTRDGIFREKEATEERKAVNNPSETLSSWTGRIRGGSQETLKQQR